MEKVWKGMPAEALPSPEDLTQEEIDSILNPLTTGVAELSPFSSLPHMITELEQRLPTLKGEEALVAEAEYATLLSDVEPFRAKDIAEKVLSEAAESKMIWAEAEGNRAFASLPWYVMNIKAADCERAASTAIELFNAVGMKYRQAEMMLGYAFGQFHHHGGALRASEEVWAARQLAIEPGDDEGVRHCVLSKAASMLAMIAWQGERLENLAKGYLAISLLHARISARPSDASWINAQIAGLHTDKENYAASLPFFTRAEQIALRNEMWNFGFMARQKLAYAQLNMGDIDTARRSLESLKDLKRDKEIDYNPFSVEFVEGSIYLAEANWAQGIALLEPLLELEGVTRATRITLLTKLSEGYEKLGESERSRGFLLKAFSLQQQVYEDRLETQARHFSLSAEIKKLQDRQVKIEVKGRRDEDLLKAILPRTAYEEWQTDGKCQASYFDNVALFYSDFAGFTKIAAGIPPIQLMQILGELFDGFDEIMEAQGCERIEAIGDAYVAVCGMSPVDDSMERMARAAIKVAQFLDERGKRHKSLGVPEFKARIGLHHGSIIGGLVGKKRLRYAIFGDAVNTAQRLEAGGEPGEITVSDDAASLIMGNEEFNLVEREPIKAKGKGTIRAWNLTTDPELAVESAEVLKHIEMLMNQGA